VLMTRPWCRSDRPISIEQVWRAQAGRAVDWIGRPPPGHAKDKGCRGATGFD